MDLPRLTGGHSKGGVSGLPARFRRDEGGVADVSNLVVIAVVLVAGVVSVVLLARTTSAANRINHKAERIAQTGRGINIATDSVIQLRRTNETAQSILASAKPVSPALAEIVAVAQGIDGLASSINGTAGSINGTGGKINGTAGEINGSAGKINKVAKDINGHASAVEGHATSINSSAGKINATARDINAQAAAILDVAKRINDDVAQINRNVDVTILLASGIKGDTANILGEAGKAARFAHCIDERLGNPSASCQ